MFRLLFTAWILSLTIAATCRGDSSELGPLLEKLRSVGTEGKGHVEASAAWQRISQADIGDVPTILAAMRGVNPLASNWLRSAVDAIAERHVQSGKPLPLPILETFVNDTTQAPRAHRTAYEWLKRSDPQAESRILPNMLNDASLEMRHDAVAVVLAEAAKSLKAGNQQEAVSLYRRALDAARDLDQIEAAAKPLEEAGQKVDVPTHFGFLLDWQLIAPFDNKDTRGFDVAYPPEKKTEFTAKYDGRSASDGDVTAIGWNQHTTADRFGIVDLNKALAKYKGAIAYAYTEFESAESRDVEFRLGCINGNKLWLNGHELMSNHVYHANMQIDQYAATGRLRKGTNRILLKIAQNEQTEDWRSAGSFNCEFATSWGPLCYRPTVPLIRRQSNCVT